MALSKTYLELVDEWLILFAVNTSQLSRQQKSCVLSEFLSDLGMCFFSIGQVLGSLAFVQGQVHGTMACYQFKWAVYKYGVWGKSHVNRLLVSSPMFSQHCCTRLRPALLQVSPELLPWDLDKSRRAGWQVLGRPCVGWEEITPLIHILVGGLEHLLCFHISGIVTPTDFHIFQRVGQPPTSIGIHVHML